jgi:8-oxo-dGTP diphosphatase
MPTIDPDTVGAAQSCWDLPGDHLKTGLPLVLVAAAVLVDADNRVLLAQRPEGKSMAGLWEFPGGKLHVGEPPELALIRELDEELGIETKPGCLQPFTFASHAYQSFHLLMPTFLIRSWRGIPHGRENQALTWVKPQELRQYPMPDADLPLIPLIQDALL